MNTERNAGSRGAHNRFRQRGAKQRDRASDRQSRAPESVSAGGRSRGEDGSANVAEREDAQVSWAALGLSSPLLEAVRALGYRQPTPIQTRAVPLALAGRDLVAMARTGSGKTAGINENEN